jgi:hypothetical protein
MAFPLSLIADHDYHILLQLLFWACLSNVRVCIHFVLTDCGEGDRLGLAEYPGRWGGIAIAQYRKAFSYFVRCEISVTERDSMHCLERVQYYSPIFFVGNDSHDNTVSWSSHIDRLPSCWPLSIIFKERENRLGLELKSKPAWRLWSVHWSIHVVLYIGDIRLAAGYMLLHPSPNSRGGGSCLRISSWVIYVNGLFRKSQGVQL